VKPSGRARQAFILGLCLSLTGCGGPQKPISPTSEVVGVPEGRLPDGVRPTGYQLSVTIVPSSDGFSGKAVIGLELDKPTTGIWMHGQSLSVTTIHAHRGDARVAATWNQRTSDGVARVEFGEELPAGRATLHIEYEARFDHPLRGLYKVESEGRTYAFTQFESISARLAFPSFDEPRFKAPFDVALTVPVDQFVAANTPVKSAIELPGGLQRVHFKPTPPLPTYLIAWAVGPFEVVAGPPIPRSEMRPHSVPLRGIAAHGQGRRLRYALDRTGEYVEIFEGYFGTAYPYQKLDLVAVPDFGAGAMENVGLITFREWLLLIDERRATEHQRRAFAYVMAHELAHQWFGNLVTMPWWNDVWLNEAFATWMGNKVVGILHPEYRVDLASLASAQHAMKLDSLTSARRIRQPVENNHDIQNAFDAITYKKGGAVLEMFERWMGADHFRDGIRLYLRRHREGTATTEDLLAALDAVDDRDVATPFRSFLTQPGVPLIRAKLECNDGRGALALSQERYFPIGSDGDPRQSWQIPLCVRTSFGVTCTLLEDEEGSIELPDCPSWWMPNYEGAGYFRFALSTADWTALRNKGFSKLSARGQIAVVDSLFAAFDQGGIDTETLLPWLPRLAASPIREIATAPMGHLRFIMEDAAPPDVRANAAAYASRLYRRRYDALGWRRRKGDSSDTKLLRETVIRFMVMDVRDPTARARAARLGKAQVGYQTQANRHAVDPQLAGLTLAAAVQEGGTGLFDHLVQMLESSTDATERSRILSALGNAEDPELATRALALTLSPTIRVNEIGHILAPQLRNPRTRDRAWAWFTESFDELAARYGKHQVGGIPWYTASFCTEAAAQEVQRFFEPRVADLMGGPRNLAGAVEAISLCAAKAEAQRPSIERAFQR
jgi:alanyl aminopeptidase